MTLGPQPQSQNDNTTKTFHFSPFLFFFNFVDRIQLLFFLRIFTVKSHLALGSSTEEDEISTRNFDIFTPVCYTHQS